MRQSSVRLGSVSKWLALGITSAALTACGTSASATGSSCPADSTLSYQSFGQAFIADNCLACHAGRERPTLSTQAQVQANIAEIDMVAAAGPDGVNTRMPEGATVSTADRARLGEWLACGAP